MCQLFKRLSQKLHLIQLKPQLVLCGYVYIRKEFGALVKRRTQRLEIYEIQRFFFRLNLAWNKFPGLMSVLHIYLELICKMSHLNPLFPGSVGVTLNVPGWRLFLKTFQKSVKFVFNKLLCKQSQGTGSRTEQREGSRPSLTTGSHQQIHIGAVLDQLQLPQNGIYYVLGMFVQLC